MPEPMVLVPMLLEPIGALPGDMVLPELEESVDGDGVLVAGGITVVLVSSTFLLQAPNANKAASATDETATVLKVDVNMRFPLDDEYKSKLKTRF